MPSTTTYHFDYEPIPRKGQVGKAEPKPRPEEQKAVGFVFANDSSSGAYYYDLRTRKPVASRVKRMVDLFASTIAITLLAPVYLVDHRHRVSSD